MKSADTLNGRKQELAKSMGEIELPKYTAQICNTQRGFPESAKISKCNPFVLYYRISSKVLFQKYAISYSELNSCWDEFLGLIKSKASNRKMLKNKITLKSLS